MKVLRTILALIAMGLVFPFALARATWRVRVQKRNKYQAELEFLNSFANIIAWSHGGQLLTDEQWERAKKNLLEIDAKVAVEKEE